MAFLEDHDLSGGKNLQEKQSGNQTSPSPEAAENYELERNAIQCPDDPGLPLFFYGGNSRLDEVIRYRCFFDPNTSRLEYYYSAEDVRADFLWSRTEYDLLRRNPNYVQKRKFPQSQEKILREYVLTLHSAGTPFIINIKPAGFDNKTKEAFYYIYTKQTPETIARETAAGVVSKSVFTGETASVTPSERRTARMKGMPLSPPSPPKINTLSPDMSLAQLLNDPRFFCRDVSIFHNTVEAGKISGAEEIFTKHRILDARNSDLGFVRRVLQKNGARPITSALLDRAGLKKIIECLEPGIVTVKGKEVYKSVPSHPVFLIGGKPLFIELFDLPQ